MTAKTKKRIGYATHVTPVGPAYATARQAEKTGDVWRQHPVASGMAVAGAAGLGHSYAMGKVKSYMMDQVAFDRAMRALGRFSMRRNMEEFPSGYQPGSKDRAKVYRPGRGGKRVQYPLKVGEVESHPYKVMGRNFTLKQQWLVDQAGNKAGASGILVTPKGTGWVAPTWESGFWTRSNKLDKDTMGRGAAFRRLIREGREAHPDVKTWAGLFSGSNQGKSRSKASDSMLLGKYKGLVQSYDKVSKGKGGFRAAAEFAGRGVTQGPFLMRDTVKELNERNIFLFPGKGGKVIKPPASEAMHIVVSYPELSRKVRNKLRLPGRVGGLLTRAARNSGKIGAGLLAGAVALEGWQRRKQYVAAHEQRIAKWKRRFSALDSKINS